MTTFTIDTDNNITAWPAPELAQASIAAGAEPFGSHEQFEKLVAGWPAERLVAIWNSLPGVKPAKEFKSSKTASSKIWDRIQGLYPAQTPKQDKKVKGLEPKSAPAQPSRKSTTKKSAKASKATNVTASPREGSKKAQVIIMLERKGGATLTEIMKKMGWQQHTVRGFMAGAMKKAGYRVQSFKPEGGERSYKLKK
jgi:hypothetical protein